MNGFQEKKIQNLRAAEILLKENHYCSSVHCSYYSCVQFLLYIVYNKLNITRKEFENTARHLKSGTHKHASKLVSTELAKIDVAEYKWYQKVFPELQLLREKADYSEEQISQAESMEAKNKAFAISNLLSRKFK